MQKESLKVLGDYLRAARKRRGLTVSVLAQKALLSDGVIKRLESGRPVATDSLFSVLFILGADERLLESLAPGSDEEATSEELRRYTKKKRKGPPV